MYKGALPAVGLPTEAQADPPPSALGTGHGEGPSVSPNKRKGYPVLLLHAGACWQRAHLPGQAPAEGVSI